MKILIVHPGVDFYGGAEILITNFAKKLRQRRHEVAVLSNWFTLPFQEQLRKADVETIVAATPSTNKVAMMMALWGGVQSYAYNYDVINVHNFPATVCAFPVRKPVVWQCNEPPELFTSLSRKPVEWWNRHITRTWIKKVVVSDEANATRFKEIYKVKPEIVPYGIDYAFFHKNVVWARHIDEEGYFTVLQVGTLTPLKNQLATIEAVGMVRPEIPNIRLIIIGHQEDENYKISLDNAIRALGLGGRVSFEPHISQEHLRNLYQMADVLMHPVKAQGSWLTPFEAMCAGLPVIVSNELTCSDVINEYSLGVVTDNYAKAILDEYNNPTPVEARKARAEYVKFNLSWDSYTTKMLGIFKKVC